MSPLSLQTGRLCFNGQPDTGCFPGVCLSYVFVKPLHDGLINMYEAAPV